MAAAAQRQQLKELLVEWRAGFVEEHGRQPNKEETKRLGLAQIRAHRPLLRCDLPPALIGAHSLRAGTRLTAPQSPRRAKTSAPGDAPSPPPVPPAAKRAKTGNGASSSSSGGGGGGGGDGGDGGPRGAMVPLSSLRRPGRPLVLTFGSFS